MLKDIGRLEASSIKEIEENIAKVFELFEKPSKASKEKAEKLLYDYAKSPNYFVREYIGKLLSEYHDKRKMRFLALRMLKHKFYGIRATGLFYFFNRYYEDPQKIMEIVEEHFESVPWEVESIINDLWKRYPEVMKEEIISWIDADNDKKRSLAFHGMENIASRDPIFIMEFINKAIDDESMEVQKKITHILTQVARSRPAESYPYIHEWLLNADEKRLKTLWVSMKKLANIVIQKSRREKTQEFVILTSQTIQDWKNDENPNVSSIGNRLDNILNKERIY